MKINNLSFGSGYTKSFEEKVRTTNIKSVIEELNKDGINAYFQDSKEIAACALQAVKIFKMLNVGLPRRIFAEKNYFVPGRAMTDGTVSFSNVIFYDLKEFDLKATNERKEHLIPTGHFLAVFLHELSHIANFTKLNLLSTTPRKIKDIPINIPYVPLEMEEYIFEHDGYHLPEESMLEVFAHSMEKRIADSLDKKTLLPKTNPFKELYSKKYTNKKDSLFNEMLKNIYEGDLENLKKNLNQFY